MDALCIGMINLTSSFVQWIPCEVQILTHKKNKIPLANPKGRNVGGECLA